MTDLKRIYQSDLPSRAIAVYLYLQGRANREGVCWPAIPTMARELKMSESTVRRGVRDLERAGCKCQRKSEPDAHEKVSHKRPRKSEPERSRIVEPVC